MFKTKWTYLVLGIVLIANLLVTLISDDEYKGEIAFELKEDAALIFKQIKNIQNKPDYRSEIDTVIITTETSSSLFSWKEVHKSDHEEVFQVLKNDSNEFAYKTVSSTRGLKGEWTYFFDSKNQVMVISESSIADTFWYKWIYTIIGRDAILEKMKETLKNQIDAEKSK